MKTCPKCKSSHQKSGKFCSRSCANSRGPRSQETKDKISKAVKQNPSGFILNRPTPKKLERVKRKCVGCDADFIVTITSTQKYCSKSCYHSSGNCGGYFPGTTGRNATIYKDIKFDSGTEASFAKLLDKHNISWVRNENEYFLYGDNKKYYPDFYLPKHDIWIEIKGKYYYNPELDPIKWKSVPNLKVFWHDDLYIPEEWRV